MWAASRGAGLAQTVANDGGNNATSGGASGLLVDPIGDGLGWCCAT